MHIRDMQPRGAVDSPVLDNWLQEVTLGTDQMLISLQTLKQDLDTWNPPKSQVGKDKLYLIAA